MGCAISKSNVDMPGLGPGKVAPDNTLDSQHTAKSSAAMSSPTSPSIKAAGQESDATGPRRRRNIDNNIIKDQIRKQLAAQVGDEGVVSDSEDEEDANCARQDTGAQAGTASEVTDTDVFDGILSNLQSNFVFKGIKTGHLTQVVQRMRKEVFADGETIVQQGAQAGPADKMYYVQSGQVDVVISGGRAGRDDDEVSESTAKHTIIRKGAGWHFGVLTLLFRAPRSASVLARGTATLWSLDRANFLAFVMRHAAGARAVRFLRKLPLLSGLNDDKLVDIASRAKEETYEAGEYLIKAGDRADGLYVIRYGNVVVKVGDKELSTLGRGKFVGERTLVTGKLRSADCVARTRVTAIVMQKREFLEVDNPMLDWMIPYDAARAVLKEQPELQSLAPEQFEQLLDRVGPKCEALQGDTLVEIGTPIDCITIFITGSCELVTADGQVVQPGPREGLLQEDGGFSSFGTCALSQRRAAPFTVRAASKSVTYITMQREQLDDLLGVRIDAERCITQNAKHFARGVLKQSRVLSKLSSEQLDALVDRMAMRQCGYGDILARMDRRAKHVMILQHGECIAAKCAVDDKTVEADMRAVDHLVMVRGDVYGELILVKRQRNPASIVSLKEHTIVFTFTMADIVAALGVASDEAAAEVLTQLASAAAAPTPEAASVGKVDFRELQMHRVVGRGQFGAVRMAMLPDGRTFALKTIYKQPITDAKQVEHLHNELSVMQSCHSPFCVHLHGAYQDQDCLYMLMDWAPGGELFHYIDLYQSFEEKTARFCAANVVLTMEYLHGKGVVYRDLKPENLVLDAHGYLKLADYGFAKHTGAQRTFTICGTPDYQAPEVIMRRGATQAVDWWAVGVLIFEMLVGEPPFMSKMNDPWDTFRRAMTGRCHVPSFVSEAAADLIYKLLQVEPDRRLGLRGADEIKQHPWFASLDWRALAEQRLPSPLVPKLSGPTDMSNFANYDAEMTPPPRNTRNDKNLWQAWDWVNTDGLNIHNVTADTPH